MLCTESFNPHLCMYNGALKCSPSSSLLSSSYQESESSTITKKTIFFLTKVDQLKSKKNVFKLANLFNWLQFIVHLQK